MTVLKDLYHPQNAEYEMWQHKNMVVVMHNKLLVEKHIIR